MNYLDQYLTAKDIRDYLKIGNDKLYDYVLKDKRIDKFTFANRYYIETESFLFFLKGTRKIDFGLNSTVYTKESLPKYVDVREFAKSFNISSNTAYKYIKDSNTFPATKIGQKYYIWIDLVPLWFMKRKK